MKSVTLPIKDFQVDPLKIHNRLSHILGEALDGVSITGEGIVVSLKSEMTQPEDYDIAIFWRDLTEEAYNTPTEEEQMAALAKIYDSARTYGKSLIAKFALENISMGITQAGKTREVADYCMKIQYYMDSGSLYAALEELQAMKLDSSGRVGLQPWLSNERLDLFIVKLKSYLKIP